MKTLTVNGLKVAYLDASPCDTSPSHHRNETVVLCHCASASSREWGSLVPLLVNGGYHVLAPDFHGYGRSDPWPGQRPFDHNADINILRALLDRTKGPVHLVGHSHGGVIALEAASQTGDSPEQQNRISSLTLIEPTLFQLLHITGHRQWFVIAKMAGRVRKAMARGDSRTAASIFTSFWIGKIKWFFMGEDHKRAITKTMKKVILEFETVNPALCTTKQYAGITAPVRLIIGTKTRAPAKVVGKLLFELLPNAELAHIRAGHMSPFTHKKQINQLIIDHLSSLAKEYPQKKL